MVLAALRAAQPRLLTRLRPFTSAGGVSAEQAVREKLVAAFAPTHVQVQDTSGATRARHEARVR
jgi:hypothetical protein